MTFDLMITRWQEESWTVNPFTPTDRFSSFQNNEWKSLLKLLSVERVKLDQEAIENN